jgi:hypothetical protein
VAREKVVREPIKEPEQFVIPFTHDEWSVISAALLESADGLTTHADRLDAKEHRLAALFLLGCAEGMSDLSGKIEAALEHFNAQYEDAVADRIVAGLVAREEQHGA